MQKLFSAMFPKGRKLMPAGNATEPYECRHSACLAEGCVCSNFLIDALFVQVAQCKQYTKITFMIKLLQFAFIYSCILPEDNVWAECMLTAQQYISCVQCEITYGCVELLPVLYAFPHIWLSTIHHPVDN